MTLQAKGTNPYLKTTAPPGRTSLSRYRKPAVQYTRKTRNHARRRKPSQTDVKQVNPETFLKSLSSINLVNVINTFYKVRMTVKDLRVSLEKLDNTMDSAYQLFGMVQNTLAHQRGHQHRNSSNLLPFPNQDQASRDKKESESSRDNHEETSPFAGLLDQVDIGQLMALVQSPMVQEIIKQFMQGRENPTKQTRNKTKEG